MQIAPTLSQLLCNVRQKSASILCKRTIAKKTKYPDMGDGRIDEQCHFPPMGKSDLPMQTRMTYLSKDMTEDKLVCIFSDFKSAKVVII